MPQIPPDINRGDVIKASWLNALKRLFISDLRVQQGSPLTMHRSDTRVTIGWSGSQIIPLSSRPSLAQITEVHDNYLICNLETADGLFGGEAVNVAQPYEVRNTTYASQTTTDPLAVAETYTYEYTSAQERIVTKVSDSTTEAQRIVPWYAPNALDVPNSTIIPIVNIGILVKDDVGNDLLCGYQEWGSPRAWAKV